MGDGTKIGVFPAILVLISIGSVWAAAPPELLPDGSLKPGIKVTVPAGEEKEFLFQPQGVRFLAGKARIVSLPAPLIDPKGQEKKEITIDADDRSQGIPWMHDEKPFRLRIRATTDFTLETREKWEGDPEKDLPKPHSFEAT